ncbi:site-specific DNA-methyltransferase [Helicobacter cinaedi]|uniref:site-specific DNA-methyltransferase n=1 Tax=Helicobacter cinaedi TaxID=213 RepID=UPI000DA12F2C|nr:DNA methyltransferase [Helicobacter cinaedi]
MLDRFHALKEHFPQCFDKNGDLMPHKLQEAILDLAQENNAQTNTATQDLENEAAFSLSKESYSLNWLGKSYAKLLRHLPTHTLIAQDSTHNTQPQNANSKNVLIKGDNLEVLKHLKNAYYRKIKMIYIDPPYNTGNGDFIYNDERSFTPQSLAQMANIEIEEVSSILNLTLKNSSTHSAWLSFMYPRLYIARQLLRDDGVIFISIDDNEQANLKLLCDEIFGEDNFVSCFVWQKKSGGGQAKHFYEGHEYVLIYCKNKDLLQGLFKIKEKGKIETDFLRKIHGKYTNNLKLKNVYEKYPNQLIEHRNLMFEEMDIFLQEKLITQEKYDEIKQNLTNGIYFLKPYNDKFNLVCRNNENNQALMYSIISGVWTSDGNTEIEQLFGKLVFNDPKPVNLLKQLIQSATMQGNSNDIILDFFAGSGTTAQAVMELNAQDKGNREFILVQLDEAISESKSKAAYEFCKNELGSENPTIFDITKERIKRASAKIAQNSNLDLGFKIYELRENDFDSQNGALFKEVDKNALLESFRLQDSTPLSVENQTIDLGGYKAIRASEKLYLLNSGFEMKHLQKLISLIDAQKDFVIKEISYLNNAFESARIREIEEGIKSYSNKKELKILVRARFA